MKLNDLHEKFGQSIWLDYIHSTLLKSGELARLVAEGVRGVTSNPAIFEKAIDGGADYDAEIEHFGRRPGESPMSVYEHLAVADIQAAADILMPVYRASDRADGYVSMEVSPYLARDTKATVAEAERLWQRVGRANLMVKVPATPEGVSAIRALIGRGINVNVTLLFSRASIAQAGEAFIAGLEDFAGRGGDVRGVASVASVFISRFDVLVDPMLEDKAKSAPAADQEALRGLLGKAAVANAKLAYQDWKVRFHSPSWMALHARGARPQRLLWASTSSKNPRYSDVMYVESLIGADTVNTIPPATLAAYRDHGKAAANLETGLPEAEKALASLDAFGVSMDDVTARLLANGVKEFASAFDALLGSIAKKCGLTAPKSGE